MSKQTSNKGKTRNGPKIPPAKTVVTNPGITDDENSLDFIDSVRQKRLTSETPSLTTETTTKTPVPSISVSPAKVTAASEQPLFKNKSKKFTPPIIPSSPTINLYSTLEDDSSRHEDSLSQFIEPPDLPSATNRSKIKQIRAKATIRDTIQLKSGGDDGTSSKSVDTCDSMKIEKSKTVSDNKSRVDLDEVSYSPSQSSSIFKTPAARLQPLPSPVRQPSKPVAAVIPQR